MKNTPAPQKEDITEADITAAAETLGIAVPDDINECMNRAVEHMNTAVIEAIKAGFYFEAVKIKGAHLIFRQREALTEKEQSGKEVLTARAVKTPDPGGRPENELFQKTLTNHKVHKNRANECIQLARAYTAAPPDVREKLIRSGKKKAIKLATMPADFLESISEDGWHDVFNKPVRSVQLLLQDLQTHNAELRQQVIAKAPEPEHYTPLTDTPDYKKSRRFSEIGAEWLLNAVQALKESANNAALCGKDHEFKRAHQFLLLNTGRAVGELLHIYNDLLTMVNAPTPDEINDLLPDQKDLENLKRDVITIRQIANEKIQRTDMSYNYE